MKFLQIILLSLFINVISIQGFSQSEYCVPGYLITNSYDSISGLFNGTNRNYNSKLSFLDSTGVLIKYRAKDLKKMVVGSDNYEVYKYLGQYYFFKVESSGKLTLLSCDKDFYILTQNSTEPIILSNNYKNKILPFVRDNEEIYNQLISKEQLAKHEIPAFIQSYNNAVYFENTNAIKSNFLIKRNDYLVLANGEQIVVENELKFKSHTLFRSPYFLIDNKKLKAKDVNFYQMSSKFYGKIPNKKGGGAEFAKLIKSSNLNLFLSTSYVNTPSPGLGYSGGVPIRIDVFYYNIGYEKLKKANYENLSKDLIDNENSMELLNLYKKYNRRSNSYLFYGLSLFVVGFTSGIILEEENPELALAGGFLSLSGFILFISSSFQHKKSQKYLTNAILSY